LASRLSAFSIAVSPVPSATRTTTTMALAWSAIAVSAGFSVPPVPARPAAAATLPAIKTGVLSGKAASSAAMFSDPVAVAVATRPITARLAGTMARAPSVFSIIVKPWVMGRVPLGNERRGTAKANGDGQNDTGVRVAQVRALAFDGEGQAARIGLAGNE